MPKLSDSATESVKMPTISTLICFSAVRFYKIVQRLAASTYSVDSGETQLEIKQSPFLEKLNSKPIKSSFLEGRTLKPRNVLRLLIKKNTSTTTYSENIG
jgi:hypothetical protein